jgi:hypothetical protein
MDKRRRVSVCGDAPSGTAVDENTVPTARVSICSFCDKSFSTPQHLRQHTEYSHATQCYPAAAVPGATGAARAASGSGVAPGVRRWDDELLHKMAVGRVNQHCPRDLAAAIKDHFAHTVATFKEQVVSRVQCHLQPGLDADSMLQNIFAVCEDLTANDSELNRLRTTKAYVQPQKRYLGQSNTSGEEFYAYDSPLDKTLEAMFATQPETVADLKAFVDKVVSGQLCKDGAYDPNLVIADTWDGCAFGKYVSQLNLSSGQLPLIFMLYYDGLEVVNGIGQARLTHELGCFYWALIPLQQHYRLNRVHFRVVTLCYKRAISELGMHTVIHGREEEQMDAKCNAWGLWMQRLSAGIKLKTPYGDCFGYGGTALLAADTPAAAEAIGTKKAVGPSTKSICRSCHCMQKSGAYDSPHRSPNSFLAGLPGWRVHCKGRKQNFPLRSPADLSTYVEKGRLVLDGKMSWQAFQDWMQSMGVNDFAAALAGVACPMDIMHVLFEGVAREQLGALCYVGFNKWGWKPLQLIKRLGEFAKEKKWHRHDLPYVNSSRVKQLSTGDAGGKPSSDCSFPGTSMQIERMIVHIYEFCRPLLTTEQRKEPVWQVTWRPTHTTQHPSSQVAIR